MRAEGAGRAARPRSPWRRGAWWRCSGTAPWSWAARGAPASCYRLAAPSTCTRRRCPPPHTPCSRQTPAADGSPSSLAPTGYVAAGERAGPGRGAGREAPPRGARHCTALLRTGGGLGLRTPPEILWWHCLLLSSSLIRKKLHELCISGTSFPLGRTYLQALYPQKERL